MSTRDSIMRYIRQRDPRAENVALHAGRGYFYFGPLDSTKPCITAKFQSTSVMTNSLRDLTAEQWLAAFVELADQVRESVVERIDAAIARLEERAGQWLFHTTSYGGFQDMVLNHLTHQTQRGTK